MTHAPTFDDHILPSDDQEPEGSNHLRKISILIVFTAISIGAMTAFGGSAEAGTCTGMAALEAPLLPVTA